jgi:hemerythrin-like domain-containing protein
MGGVVLCLLLTQSGHWQLREGGSNYCRLIPINASNSAKGKNSYSIFAGVKAMPRTMDVLLQEHRTIAKLLDLLERELGLLEKSPTPSYDLMLQIVDYFRTFPDLYHHPKEDLVFRRLVERDPEQAAKFGDLEAEHQHCSNRLADFSRAVVVTLLEAETPSTFAGLARDFIDNERRHMASEENALFPAAIHCLTKDDWAEIDARSARFKDPLLEEHTGDRLDLLRSELTKAPDPTAA